MSDTAVTLSADEKKVIDALEKLNVVSLNNVVKYMEEVYGISAAPAAIAVAGPAGGAAAAPAEEKTSFALELVDAGAQKIQVIKVVREITGLGLGEAKAKVDSAGVLKEGMPKDEAEAAKKKLEEVGAKVNLQ